MAENFFKPFQDMLDSAHKFVEEQKGMWDENKWQEFLSNIQQKGIEVTDDMKAQLGTMLDSMKNVYGTMSATEGMSNALAKITEEVIQFVKQQNGQWDHEEWEKFLQSLQQRGVVLTDEMKDYIGAILESAKNIYAPQGQGGPTGGGPTEEPK